jgi:hypothetical protein
MAPDSSDMSDLDRPVTRRELRAELHELRAELATKAEKVDLHATTEQLRTEMSTGFAEMRDYVDFSVKSLGDELRTHFDVIAESLRADIHNMFDWMKANINGVTTRVDAIETGHGTRLTTLETRVTKLEADRN